MCKLYIDVSTNMTVFNNLTKSDAHGMQCQRGSKCRNIVILDEGDVCSACRCFSPSG